MGGGQPLDTIAKPAHPAADSRRSSIEALNERRCGEVRRSE
jgi:hypothetical protein